MRKCCQDFPGVRNCFPCRSAKAARTCASNDGSPRFYRELAFLQERQGPRLLICSLDVDSLLMGNILGFKDQAVKAVLVNKKKSVANVLKSLIGLVNLEAPNRDITKGERMLSADMPQIRILCVYKHQSLNSRRSPG